MGRKKYFGINCETQDEEKLKEEALELFFP